MRRGRGPQRTHARPLVLALLGLIGLGALPRPGLAQVVLDGSLGMAGALPPDGAGEIVIPESVGRRSGTNLFHSFSDFNVNTGQTAHFTSAGPGIDNVLARITGGAPSRIDGVLRSSIADADLYLFNPQGIFFGPEATLDLPAALFASTSSTLRFGDGTRLDTEPVAPLLTSAPPSAWGFEQAAPARIEVAESRLMVGAGSTLSLAGGGLEIVGRSDEPAGEAIALQAPAGRLDLVAVSGPGEVPLDARLLEPRESTIRLGEVRVSDGAVLDASGNGGGGLVIRAHDLSMTSSSGFVGNTGASAANAIGMDIRLSGDLLLASGSFLTSVALDGGDSPDITIDVPDGRLMASDASGVVTNAFTASGSGGDLSVLANAIRLERGSQLVSATAGPGHGGHIRVEADRIEIDGVGALIGAVTQRVIPESTDDGDGGDVDVYAREIVALGGAQILTRTTSSGDGGDVRLHDVGSVRLDGVSITGTFGQSDYVVVPSSITANEGQPGALSGPVGVGGDLSISGSDRIEITDGGAIQLRSFVTGDTRPAGSALPAMTIGAREIVLAGGVDRERSQIFMSTLDRDIGRGTLVADEIRATDGSFITASAQGAGAGGELEVKAERILLSGRSVERSATTGIFTGTNSEFGNAGDGGRLYLHVRELEISDGGEVSVASRGVGDPGTLSINPVDRALSETAWANEALITVSDGRILSAARIDPSEPRTGGDLEIRAGSLVIERGGEVAAFNEAGSDPDNDAGNITILLADTLEMTDGRIATEALNGLGGRIRIEAARLISLLDSEITSSVTEGNGDAGGVELRSDLVYLNRASVATSATVNNGGDILIDSDFLVISADSTLDASGGDSDLAVDGEIILRTVEEDLPQELAPLPETFFDEADELRRSCAARRERGGSLTVQGPVLRIGPDGPLPIEPPPDHEQRRGASGRPLPGWQAGSGRMESGGCRG